MAVSIICDEGNGEISQNGNHYCDNCLDEQKDAVKDLEDKIVNLEEENKELEAKLTDIEKEET